MKFKQTDKLKLYYLGNLVLICYNPQYKINYILCLFIFIIKK